MRRSTLYILLLVIMAVTASAVIPQVLSRFMLSRTDAADREADNSTMLAPGQLPAAISLEGEGCDNLMIQSDTAATVSVSTSRDADIIVSFDESTKTLVIAPAEAGGCLPEMISVTLTPDCALSAIGGLDSDATLSLAGISTPALAIGRFPETMLVSDCTVGHLVIGPAGGDNKADVSLSDTRIDTLVSGMPMGRVNLYTSDTEIGLSTFATSSR